MNTSNQINSSTGSESCNAMGGLTGKAVKQLMPKHGVTMRASQLIQNFPVQVKPLA